MYVIRTQVTNKTFRGQHVVINKTQMSIPDVQHVTGGVLALTYDVQHVTGGVLVLTHDIQHVTGGVLALTHDVQHVTGGWGPGFDTCR